LVDVTSSYQHYRTLKRLGFDAAELHCGNYALDKEMVKAFSQRFGSQNTRVKKDLRIKVPKSPLVNIQPRGSKPPFFCVHAIGGGVFSYYDLSKSIGKDQPFYGLESFGMEGDEAPLSSIEIMATRYIEAIRFVSPDGPYQIGGWSMGGLVAYEMAQQLLAQQQSVSKLILFDSQSLSRNWKTTIKYSNRLLGDFLEKLCYYFKHQDTSLDIIIGYLPDANWPKPIINENELSKDDRIITRYRELANILGVDSSELNLLLDNIIQGASGTALISIWKNLEAKNEKSSEVQLQHAIRRLDVYLNNLRAIHKYNPRPYPHSLTLIRAKDHLSMFEIDQTLGWRKLARGGVDVHTVPGDHYTMFNRPNVKVLAEEVNARLNDANGMGI
jgi:thioesterase domain-containing protein